MPLLLWLFVSFILIWWIELWFALKEQRSYQTYVCLYSITAVVRFPNLVLSPIWGEKSLSLNLLLDSQSIFFPCAEKALLLVVVQVKWWRTRDVLDHESSRRMGGGDMEEEFKSNRHSLNTGDIRHKDNSDISHINHTSWPEPRGNCVNGISRVGIWILLWVPPTH